MGNGKWEMDLWAKELMYVNLRKEAILHPNLPQSEINRIELEKCKIPVQVKTKRILWAQKGAYYIESHGNWKILYVSEGGKIHAYTSNTFDEELNDGKIKFTGREARKEIETAFRIQYKHTIRKSFGTYNGLHDWAPKPIYYLNKTFAGYKMKNTTIADFSSMYPFCAMGKLPDAHTAKLVEGLVDPSEEWPVCFRGDGSTAEYKKFDTRDFRGEEIYSGCLSQMEKNFLAGSEMNPNYTILMKYADEILDPIIEPLYMAKSFKGDLKAKHTLNAFIGTFGSTVKGFPKMDHVRNVILGRANKMHYDAFCKLKKAKANILEMVVDSFIFTGGKENDIWKFVTREKKIGALLAKYENITFLTTEKINQYVVYGKDGSVIDCKHGAMQIDDEEFARDIKLYIKKEFK